MTELLEKAVEALRKLSATDQNAIARSLIVLAQEDVLEDVEPEHRAAVMEGMAQAERGEFATDEDVAQAFRNFDR